MPKYRVYDEDGGDAGEASYAVYLRPGDVIWMTGHTQVRVLEVRLFEDEESPYVGAITITTER